MPALALCLAWMLQAADPPGTGNERSDAVRIERTLERGRRWLAGQRDVDGVFRPRAVPGACPVALSAMAAWALVRAGTDPAELDATTRFLVAQVQPDDGLYDPDGGLAVYTSGVAACALRSLGFGEGAPEKGRLLNDLELFVYRRSDPESLVDTERPEATPSRALEEAHELLREADSLDDGERAALEFLARCRRDVLLPAARLRVPGRDPGAGFGYDDLLPLVYRTLKAEHQVVGQAVERIRESFTLERNPDLTRRYGQGGFQPGSQGLYYYYLILARTLATRESPLLELADGRVVNWARELARKLTELQRGDGSWVNADPRWWEGEPVLVTSYALLSVSLCRDAMSTR